MNVNNIFNIDFDWNTNEFNFVPTQMARKNAQRSPLRGRKFDTGRRAPPTVSNHFRVGIIERENWMRRMEGDIIKANMYRIYWSICIY